MLKAFPDSKEKEDTSFLRSSWNDIGKGTVALFSLFQTVFGHPDDGLWRWFKTD